MAQIKNPENGATKGKVTVVGYSERFFLNATPPVHIMNNLSEIGAVEKNGKVELDIDKESRIVFKCNQCTCRFSPCVVKPNDWVVLVYDRAVDSMLPIITNEENHIRVREEYYKNERKRRRKFFLRMLLIVLILCGVAGGIYGVYGGIHAKHVREARKAKLAKVLKDRGLFNIEDPNAYTIEELERMQFGENLLPSELRKKMEENGDFSGRSSSPRANDYNDLKRQVENCDKAKQQFLHEIDDISNKARSPQYQGIMAQKLFWEANEALDKFNKESEELERSLRKAGMQKEADEHKEARENLNQVYREEKRKAQDYK